MTDINLGIKKPKNNDYEFYAKEWLKCKQNPFYFIYNYVYLSELGGKVKLTPQNLHYKMKRVIRALYHYHKCELMASRQLGKSAIAACIIAWALVFYPENIAIILNMKQNAGLKNLSTIKFIINQLPEWMVTPKPFTQKSDIKTYFELFNGSRCDVFYPSTIHSASTLARSLTSPILYVDEAAYIKDMQEIYGSAQQTLSKAREQAIKNNYPYFQLITSTPNGTFGIGQWFYRRWMNGVESDSLFASNGDNDEKWDNSKNISSIVNDSSKNSFIRVKYHWSEDPSKDEQWYIQQCQELDDERQINQELDLKFVGTSNSLFSDTILSKFKGKQPVKHEMTPNGANFYIFEDENELNSNDYYLVGVDTAESLEGAYCSIEIFSFKDFHQIAEVNHKYGSYTNFSNDIHYVFQWLFSVVGHNIILCNENNSIGRAPIENLLNRTDFNYFDYFYVENDDENKRKKEEFGIKTTGMSKPLMVGCFIESVKGNENCIKSQELINQISAIEKTSTGNIKSNHYSDLFMGACFCAYVRNKTAIEILPLIEGGNKVNSTPSEQAKMVSSLNDVKKDINNDAEESGEIVFNDSDDWNDDINIYLPV